MARLVVQDGNVICQLSIGEKIFGFHGSPQASITDVVRIERISNFWKYSGWRGVRAPGTGIPGIVGLGTWRKLGAKTFCAIYKKEGGFRVTLKNSEFESWLVSTSDLPAELEEFTS